MTTEYYTPITPAEPTAETFLRKLWAHAQNTDEPSSFYFRKVEQWCDGECDDAMEGL